MNISSKTSYSTFSVIVEAGDAKITSDVSGYNRNIDPDFLDGIENILRDAFHFEKNGLTDIDFVKDFVERALTKEEISDLIVELSESNS